MLSMMHWQTKNCKNTNRYKSVEAHHLGHQCKIIGVGMAEWLSPLTSALRSRVRSRTPSTLPPLVRTGTHTSKNFRVFDPCVVTKGVVCSNTKVLKIGTGCVSCLLKIYISLRRTPKLNRTPTNYLDKTRP